MQNAGVCLSNRELARLICVGLFLGCCDDSLSLVSGQVLLRIWFGKCPKPKGGEDFQGT